MKIIICKKLEKRVQLIELTEKLHSLFLFVFAVVGLFRFVCIFNHLSNYGIELGGILRCDNWTPGILFDALPNLTSIATATTGNPLAL